MPRHLVLLSLALPILATAALLRPAAAADAVVADAGDNGTAVHLVEQVARQIPHDRMTVVLRVEAKGAKAAAVQAEVNRRMQAALDKAKSVAGMTISSGGYSVYRQPPATPTSTAPDVWIASQALTITAAHFETALTLIGDLQGDGLVVQSLAFEVAPETLHAAQDAMSDAALAALRARAEHVAAAMDMRVARYISIDVGNVTTAEPRPMPLRMMAPQAAALAAPPAAAEASDATAMLTVDAEVILESKK